MSENTAAGSERSDLLIECPFCGGAPVMRKTVEEYPADGAHPAGDFDAFYEICCDACGIKVGDEYRDEAISEWNSRVILPEVSIRTFRLVEAQIESGSSDNALELIRYFISKNAGREDTQAMIDVLEERRRQVDAEGFDVEHDDKHDRGQIVRAALNYAAAASTDIYLNRQYVSEDRPPFEMHGQVLRWPWDSSWWKPASPRRMLVKAAALIIAEIERLDRTGGAS